MKKILCLALCGVMLLCCGCGGNISSNQENKAEYKVLKTRLTEMPCYALSENATTDDMRNMALKAHRDGLTVNWYTSENFSYTKIGPGDDRIFRYNTHEIYCGLPYTMGDTGLLHWLQFYDFSTGRMTGDFTKNIQNRFGNGCSESIKWAWATVCPDVTWDFPINETPINGCIPVGEFKMDKNIRVYNLVSTNSICEQNGEQVMYRSYAKLKIADVVDTYPNNHTMMVNGNPVVVYNDDGSINPQKSYVPIEDQRMGITSNNPPFLTVGKDGKMYHQSGRTECKYPFASLYKEGYIPLTCAQFIGEKKYEKAVVTSSLNKTPETYKEIEYSYILSNYNIVCVYADISDINGKTVVSDKAVNHITYYQKSEDKKTDKQHYLKMSLKDNYNHLLNKKSIKEKLTSGEKYKIKISAMVATGEIFDVINETVVYNKE